jgi:hypothetical protein
MMDAMKMALKKHMGKLKGVSHGAHGPDKQEEKSKTDNAPDLNDGPDDLAEAGHPDSAHADLMEQLMGQISHPGRAPMTLDERANDKMKEKMASVMKHKKA